MSLNGEQANRTQPSIHDLPNSERPRERLQRYGESALSAVELLAIVLSTGHAQDDVLQLAQRLLVAFGDLSGLANATRTELMAVKGIGDVKATRLKATQELGRRFYTIQPQERLRVDSPADAANLLMTEMMHLEQEQVRTILLDTRNYVLNIPTIYIGSLNRSVIRIGELFRTGIRENAAAMIMVHNHPSGDPSPSPEDIRVTKQVVEAGELIGIDVMDHIIIGKQRFVSLKERGLGFD